MLLLHTLASGSEGNCLLVRHGDAALLVDAGISLRRIKAGLSDLGLTMDHIQGILLTHSHSDHVCALATLVKHHPTPLYATAGTAGAVERKLGALPQLHTLAPDARFTIRDFRVQLFPTAHDAPQSVGCRIDAPSGSVGILTDTGYVTQAAAEVLTGAELLVLESNHDPETLRSGPYPPYLKERILGRQGHLSNDDAAAFAVEMARRGTRQILLAHLSRENNTPAMALETVRRALRWADLDTAVAVAPRSGVSPCYRAGTV